MSYNLRQSTKAKTAASRERHGTAKEAMKGNTQAQYELAMDYMRAKNHKKAYTWFRRAASQGHDDALDMLGGCYMKGYGVEKDDIEADRLCSLYEIKQKLNRILFYIRGHNDSERKDDLKILMESIYQFTGYVK